VIFVALVLQALLFSFGGFAVLGANTLLLAAPAVLAHFVLRPFIGGAVQSQRKLMLLGSLAAIIGIGGATLIASAMLWSAGQQTLLNLIVLFSAAQVPVLVIDAIVSALVVAALGRALPSIFRR
jgi:cobalt/nickel transport system permease protein